MLMNGSDPYPGMLLEDVKRRVTLEGYRLTQPPKCPENIYAIMLDCWNQDPQKRPSFKEILIRLKEIDREIPDDKEADVQLLQQTQAKVHEAEESMYGEVPKGHK
jgi:hypothetical protein